MKVRALLVGLLIFSTGTVYAYCPSMVKCKLDGEYMSQDTCYYNAGHKSCKYSHDYDGPNGTEHHYVIISCDDN